MQPIVRMAFFDIEMVLMGKLVPDFHICNLYWKKKAVHTF